MAYLVVAYPKIQAPDMEWIEAYRKQYDRQFSLVKPHFSLVFAVQDMARVDFLSEVKKQIAGIRPFDIDIGVATINLDDSGNYYHEFLVPDTGYSDIVKLHDKLYSDALKPHLRFDITFIPHISIGDSESGEISKQRVDELNMKDFKIHGRIEDVDVIEYANNTVTTVEKITL
jgi:hypothetical protein